MVPIEAAEVQDSQASWRDLLSRMYYQGNQVRPRKWGLQEKEAQRLQGQKQESRKVLSRLQISTKGSIIVLEVAKPKQLKILGNPRYEATSPKIGRYVHYIKNHAVIKKFMGSPWKKH
jgi:hypothetical protein